MIPVKGDMSQSNADPPPPDRDADDGVVLAMHDVSKRFAGGGRTTEALAGVSLEVRRGQITGLIGPDGAGKTTLMRLAAGLLLPDAGEIRVLGLDVVREPLAVQASVGYMPQRFGLYDDLSVQENLDLYADLQGVPPRERSGRYEELMHMTGLAPFMRRLAGQLSGGMKQKLGLACTLIRPPPLLLLDEPTVGVDPVSRRELWQIVDRFVREEQTGVLLSTAYLDEAERCRHVIILDDGKLVAQGAPQEFSQSMAGRSYMVTAPDMKTRELESALAGRPGVTDAVISGDAVRVVMDSSSEPSRLTEALGGASVAPVAPRFEDSFIAMLSEHREGAAKPKDHAKPPAAGSPRRDHQGPMIEVRDLQRRFGDFYAVKNVTFEVAQGEVFGLLGANGAGKTTTFRMLCGLLPPSAGELHVAGVDLRRAAAAARARIGYMSQKFSLYGNLSVEQNLRFFASAYGLTGPRRAERIAWALEEFELRSVESADSGSLPLGYKQRLALACALMHEPDILFLDEPTSGVDPLARREFWRQINAVASAGVTVLVTTHFMEEVEYCDRAAIMAAGEILALGAPREIKRRASTPENPEPTMEDAFIRLIETREERSQPSAERRGEQEPKGSPKESAERRDDSRRAAANVAAAGRQRRLASSAMRLRGLMRKEWLQIWRDPSSLAIAFLLPVMLLVLFGWRGVPA